VPLTAPLTFGTAGNQQLANFGRERFVCKFLAALRPRHLRTFGLGGTDVPVTMIAPVSGSASTATRDGKFWASGFGKPESRRPGWCFRPSIHRICRLRVERSAASAYDAA